MSRMPNRRCDAVYPTVANAGSFLIEDKFNNLNLKCTSSSSVARVEEGSFRQVTTFPSRNKHGLVSDQVCMLPNTALPTIPKSQHVSNIKEPLYSAILHARGQGFEVRKDSASMRCHPPPLYPKVAIYKTSNIDERLDSPNKSTSNTAYIPVDASRIIYANYDGVTYAGVAPNYGELETIRSSDSQSSQDEVILHITPSPPSPVSSSYSELIRTNHKQIVSDYRPVNFTDNTIYEPIQTSLPRTSRRKPPPPPPQDNNLDYFGTCNKCSERIVGEGTGCTAMGRVYHIACFTCSRCNCLLQGRPFYALDGKPFCEQDYLSTLEKCCKCLKPILDRILRATGKPYHPNCFTCVVCDRSLDGIPFTVDATNTIHCIDDFHRRFAPRCSVCHHPIMPQAGEEETVRVVALDRSFHVDCYRCEDCGLLLSSESDGRGCYPLDDHVLCKNCNTARIQKLTYHIGNSNT